MTKYKYLIFDTETNGLPNMYKNICFPKFTDLKSYNEARLIQLSWVVYNHDDTILSTEDYYIYNPYISINNSHIHGITEEIIKEKGHDLIIVLDKFTETLKDDSIKYIICHNIKFDMNIIKSELYRSKKKYNIFTNKKLICTLEISNILKKNNLIKNCKLNTVYEHFYNCPIENAHNSLYDVLNTGKVFQKLKENKYIII